MSQGYEIIKKRTLIFQKSFEVIRINFVLLLSLLVFKNSCAIYSNQIFLREILTWSPLHTDLELYIAHDLVFLCPIVQMEQWSGRTEEETCAPAGWLLGVFSFSELCGGLQLGIPQRAGIRRLGQWPEDTRGASFWSLPHRGFAHQRCGDQQVCVKLNFLLCPPAVLGVQNLNIDTYDRHRSLWWCLLVQLVGSLSLDNVLLLMLLAIHNPYYLILPGAYRPCFV